MFELRPFLIALQFLTAVPVRFTELPAAEETGRSLVYYPLVGLLIGAALAGLAWLLGDAPALVVAALLLVIWVGMTGALHLDGLADSADAWIGGLGDRDKTLAIMKDPCCGPYAVVILVLLLLIKFAALAHLVPNGHWEVVLLTPVFGRTALILLFLSTPYVRPNGLGSLLAAHLPRAACAYMVIFTLVAMSFFLGLMLVELLFVAACVFLLMRRFMQQRLGGMTGDTAGALVEVTETVVLLAAVLMVESEL